MEIFAVTKFEAYDHGQQGVQETNGRCRTPGDRTIATPHCVQNLDLDP